MVSQLRQRNDLDFYFRYNFQFAMQSKQTQTHTKQSLPRIYSHKKLTPHLPSNSTLKHSEESEPVQTLPRPRSQTTLRSARKNLQSVNSSKAARLQVTTASYLKKIEMFQKQQFLIDRQIQAVKEEISKLRIKRKGGDQAASTISSRCTVLTVEEGCKTKVESLRRKVDKQKQYGKKIMFEIEKVRKQIQTTKKLTNELTEELTQWNNRFAQQLSVSNQLEQTIALKNQELHKKKLQMAHQKGQVLKDYDSILRKLDSQINQSNSQATPSSDFYITDVTSNQALKSKKNKLLPQNSPKSKKLANQVQFFRQKMDQWKGQSESIKQKVNANSLEQAEQKLIQVHQNNYQQYKYVNTRFAYLQELKLKNEELQTSKQRIVKELENSQITNSQKQILNTQLKIKKVCENQEVLRGKITQIDKLYANLKDFVSNLITSTGLFLPSQQPKTTLLQQITFKNLSTFLHEVLQLKQNLQKPIKQERQQTTRTN